MLLCKYLGDGEEFDDPSRLLLKDIALGFSISGVRERNHEPALAVLAVHDSPQEIDIGPTHLLHQLDLHRDQSPANMLFSLRSEGLVPTEKMRPSIPTSPTFTLSGKPARGFMATTA